MPRDRIFISYSHLDKKWLTMVRQHLSILEFNHEFEVWDDTKLKTGSTWRNEIEQSVKKCQIAILLVSNNFLASEFIVKDELPRILDLARREGVVIFNIIIDICAFHVTALDVYQCLNDPKVPLEELLPRDRKRVLVSLTTQLLELSGKQRELSTEKYNVSSDEEDNYFSVVIVLTYLVKNGGKTITDIQNDTTLRRKLVVSALDKLKSQHYIVKIQEIRQDKPSTLWKASDTGCMIFSQFEQLYKKAVSATEVKGI